MKQHALLSLIFLSICTLLIGCSSDTIYEPSSKVSPYQSKDFSQSEGITLMAHYEKEKLILKVSNQSPYDIQFGREYFLEKKIDGQWRKMSPVSGSIAFKDIVYHLDPNQSFSYSVKIGSLPKGVYRIIKKDITFKSLKKDLVLVAPIK